MLMFRQIAKQCANRVPALACSSPSLRCISRSFSPVFHTNTSSFSTFSKALSKSTAGEEVPEQVEQLSTNEYHRISEQYLETLFDHLELISELDHSVDVEYSDGVMTLEIDSIGTYVINKQPPNKQIWLSSPVSGPKRFDYNAANNKWVSLRDGSILGDIIRTELNEALNSSHTLPGIDN